MSNNRIETVLAAQYGQTVEVGIWDEADTLQTASVWGAVGAEAVIAQCYPESISLFYQSFNVIAARQEGVNYAQILRDHGIKVLMIRDLLAESLKPKSLTKDKVISDMTTKARDVQTAYNTHIPKVDELIVGLVEQDINRYGSERALTLNHTLTVSPKLPLGNSIYSRDQMIILLGTRIASTMAKPIRAGEVGLYETVYKDHLAPHKVVHVPKGETFEGGDAYIHNGTVFVGVGTRTTMGGAISIYETLKVQLEEHDLSFAVVEDEAPFDKPFSQQQESMHLDTFSNPIGRKEIAVCVEEASKRRVKFLSTLDGQLVMRDGFGSFIDFLERTEDHILTVSKAEQRGFGCNFLLQGVTADGGCTVFVPLKDNTETNSRLEKLGKRVIHTDLFESTRGYGAAHCMTGQLFRSNI